MVRVSWNRVKAGGAAGQACLSERMGRRGPGRAEVGGERAVAQEAWDSWLYGYHLRVEVKMLSGRAGRAHRLCRDWAGWDFVTGLPMLVG